MSRNEMNQKAQELRELLSMIEELNAEADAIRDAFKAQMVEQGADELKGDGWKASWKTVTSLRFDSKSFKAEQPELFEKYSKPQTVCRFCLS